MSRMVSMGAKSAAAQLVDTETAEIRFLMDDNQTLSVTLSQQAAFSLARRIMALAD